jgi:hypothetical protein
VRSLNLELSGYCRGGMFPAAEAAARKGHLVLAHVPMEALGPLIGENLGVERAPIEVREDGLTHSVRIGDAVDFEVEDIVPFGVESGEAAKLVGIFHPAGPDLTVAHATRSRIDAFGISYEGKSAFSRSEFAWAA